MMVITVRQAITICQIGSSGHAIERLRGWVVIPSRVAAIKLAIQASWAQPGPTEAPSPRAQCSRGQV